MEAVKTRQQQTIPDKTPPLGKIAVTFELIVPMT